jgi:chemotaxis protein MotB
MGKKGKCPEFENHERWLVSYADMLTLLFAVFVVLFALKEGGEPQVQKAAGAMQESFNTPLEDIPLDRAKGPMEQGFGIFDHFKGDQILAPLVDKYPSFSSRVKVIEAEMDQVKAEIEERLYGPEKNSKMDDVGMARIVSVERTATGFKLQLVARYFFEEGSTKIKPGALKNLDEVIDVVHKLGRDVTIEGHTDAQPQHSKQSTWDVSTLRATAVVKYMIEHHRFPPSKLSAAGYADTRPIAHNGTESGRRLNRRIEIHVNYLGETREPTP